MDDVISSVDDGHVVAMMSLDISAAFDSVIHDVLVQRLEEEFVVTGTCRQWIQGYLTGRSFTVRVGQSTSSPIPMTTGVPQGSVLGPILYTTYVGPISRLIASYGVEHHDHHYADHIQILGKYNLMQNRYSAVPLRGGVDGPSAGGGSKFVSGGSTPPYGVAGYNALVHSRQCGRGLTLEFRS